MKILILESNPRKDLDLNKEIRDLEGVVKRSRHRDQFEVKIGLAVGRDDLQELLLDYEPQIVHFCGHGAGEQGLVMQTGAGQEQLVPTGALSSLFELFADRVECILLNACYSEVQADAIVSHINYVVGMSQAIRDDAAIAFATGFYRALGYGRSIEEAYKFGCNAIQLSLAGSASGSVARSTVSEEQRKFEVVDVLGKTVIPEYLKPILKVKPTLARQPEPIPDPTETEIQVNVDKALEQEAQYRDRVQERQEPESKEDELPEQSSLPFNLSRRRAVIITASAIAFGGTGISVAVAAGRSTQQPPSPILQTSFFGTVTVNGKGGIDTRRLGQARFFEENLGDGILLTMVAIPGGTFWMGSPSSELQRDGDESPQHQVTVRPFFMGKVAVTQAQWKAVSSLSKVTLDLQSDPSHFKGSDRPVELVSWHHAVEFCDRLSQKTGKSYRLPSEAEWEYACRAGTTTPFHFGEMISTDLANYAGDYAYGSGVKGQYRQQTTQVGSFPPNAFGLYDMHGNVWEWCSDRSHETYEGAPIDGSAWTDGNSEFRLLRGGSWGNNPWYCRSANRSRNVPDLRTTSLGFGLSAVLRGLNFALCPFALLPFAPVRSAQNFLRFGSINIPAKGWT